VVVREPWGVLMGNESNAPLPSRRAPGRQQGPQAPAVVRPAIADPVLERMRIAVARERGHQGGTEESAAGQPAAGSPASQTASSAQPSSDRSDLQRPAVKVRPRPRLPWFDIDPNEDTTPQPAIGKQEAPAPDQPASKQPWEDLLAETVSLQQAPAVDRPASKQPWASLLPAISTEQRAPADRPASAQPRNARPQQPARPAATSPARRARDEVVSPQHGGRRRPRLSTVLIVLLSLIAAGSMAVALHRSGDRAPRNSGPPGQASAARISKQAAAWVVTQISQQTTVGCDPAMCGVLVARGIHPDRLLELQSAASDPLAAPVVVITPAIRHLFGSKLLAQDAPVSLASFGTGSQQISVGLVAQHGAAALTAMLAADLKSRKESGAALLSSSRISFTPAAKAQLTAGQVDSRLILVLAKLAAQYPIDIIAFTDSGPHASADVPLRSAELAQSPNDPIVSAKYAQSVRAFLGAQNAPYRPAGLSLVPLSRRQTVLVVEFPAPSPLLLLSPRRG
jgi:hypothetical protein